jgi:hypothetical protein
MYSVEEPRLEFCVCCLVLGRVSSKKCYCLLRSMSILKIASAVYRRSLIPRAAFIVRELYADTVSFAGMAKNTMAFC